MKKLLSLLLCMILAVFSLAACSEKTDDGADAVNGLLSDNQKQIEITTFDELVSARQEVQESVESMRLNAGLTLSLDVMGEIVEIDGTVNCESDIKNKLVHTSVDVTAMGEETVSEAYVDMSDGYTSYFTSGAGNWYKEGVDEDTLKLYEELLGGENDYTLSEFITPVGFEKTDYNGKECYRAEYSVRINVREMLLALGISEAIDEYISQEGTDAETEMIIETLFGELGSVSVVEYVDAETLYTVYAQIDMKSVLSTAVDRILETVLSAYGEDVNAEELGISISVNEFSIDAAYSDYNAVSVEIPEEVLGAQEMDSLGVIGGADGPTSIIVS